jgi:hypothetical protein
MSTLRLRLAGRPASASTAGAPTASSEAMLPSRRRAPQRAWDLPRPLLWIEHRPARRRGPGRYFLHTFPSYTPRIVGAGFVRRVTLGASRREPLDPAEVDTLIREA